MESDLLFVRLGSSSTIQVLANTYSVHRRLIGQKVVVMVGSEELDIYVGEKVIDRFPSLLGNGGHPINPTIRTAQIQEK